MLVWFYSEGLWSALSKDNFRLGYTIVERLQNPSDLTRCGAYRPGTRPKKQNAVDSCNNGIECSYSISQKLSCPFGEVNQCLPSSRARAHESVMLVERCLGTDRRNSLGKGLSRVPFKVCSLSFLTGRQSSRIAQVAPRMWKHYRPTPQHY